MSLRLLDWRDQPNPRRSSITLLKIELKASGTQMPKETPPSVVGEEVRVRHGDADRCLPVQDEGCGTAGSGSPERSVQREAHRSNVCDIWLESPTGLDAQVVPEERWQQTSWLQADHPMVSTASTGLGQFSAIRGCSSPSGRGEGPKCLSYPSRTLNNLPWLLTPSTLSVCFGLVSQVVGLSSLLTVRRRLHGESPASQPLSPPTPRLYHTFREYRSETFLLCAPGWRSRPSPSPL